MRLSYISKIILMIGFSMISFIIRFVTPGKKRMNEWMDEWLDDTDNDRDIPESNSVIEKWKDVMSRGKEMAMEQKIK